MGSSTKFESLIGYSDGVMRLRTQNFCWGSTSKFAEPDFTAVFLWHPRSCEVAIISFLAPSLWQPPPLPTLIWAIYPDCSIKDLAYNTLIWPFKIMVFSFTVILEKE